MTYLNELITSVRYKLKEMPGASISDQEITEAINKSLRLLYTRMGEKFVHSSVKKTILIVENHESVALPSDFHSVSRVRTETGALCHVTPQKVFAPFEYRIIGYEFEAFDGVYVLEYHYIPAYRYNENDAYDIPASVEPYLISMVVAMLAGSDDVVESIAQTCCHSLAAGNISHFSDTGPVQVWGGRA